MSDWSTPTWLDEVKADSTAMAEVKAAVEKWREFRFKMDSAEAIYAEAKRQYDDYVKVFAQVFRTNGLESLKLEDGSEVGVVAKVSCSIQKAHKTEVAQWLREHGAEQLVKAQLIVMPSAKKQLDEMKIAYDEEVDMNTNSVKAWVRGEMDMQNVAVDDLPKGLSWFVYDDVQVKE